MEENKIINFGDMNYAVYKIGDWKNDYEINQIGLSHEIPVTKNTVAHVKFTMEEIRRSQFDISDKKVNGFVAIAIQLNPKVQKMELEKAIELEEMEFQNISHELDNLELLDDEDSIELENEEYLIYKLEKEHHITNSIPANKFTKKFYLDEMKRIDDALS